MLTGKNQVSVMNAFPHSFTCTFKEDDSRVDISYEELNAAFLDWKSGNLFSTAHFNVAEDFHRFWLDHPEYVKIIQIRDLRDVCVSCVFHQSDEIEKEIGPCSFADKLLFVITLGNRATKNRLFHIKKQAQLAADWMQCSETVVCRFENLIGEKGGGNLEPQRNQILAIAKNLKIDLNAEKLEWITTNLFGIISGPSIPSTFREGKAGSWRYYFDEVHKKAFIEHLGEIQLNLGYNLFDDDV